MLERRTWRGGPGEGLARALRGRGREALVFGEGNLKRYPEIGAPKRFNRTLQKVLSNPGTPKKVLSKVLSNPLLGLKKVL